jgi:hypothetical protein
MTYHYKPEQGAFDQRLIALAERIEAEAADDSNATLIRSIWRVSRYAYDPRQVFIDAISRVINAEKAERDAQ